MNRLFDKTLCLIMLLAISIACNDNHPLETEGPEENIDDPGKPNNPHDPGGCSELAFLERFGKEWLMVGAMAEDPFFQRNPNLMDVRYIYLADAIFTGPEVPSQYREADSRWWGWWQDHSQTLPNFDQHFQWVAELKNIIKKPLVSAEIIQGICWQDFSKPLTTTGESIFGQFASVATMEMRHNLKKT